MNKSSFILGLIVLWSPTALSYPRGYKPPKDDACVELAKALDSAKEKTQTHKELLISKPGSKPRYLQKQKLTALNAQLQANKIAPQFNTAISMRIMGGIFAEKIDPMALTKKPTDAEVEAIGEAMDKAHRGCQVTMRYDLNNRIANYQEKWVPKVSKEITNPDGSKTKIENKVEFFEDVRRKPGAASSYTITPERISSLILGESFVALDAARKVAEEVVRQKMGSGAWDELRSRYNLGENSMDQKQAEENASLLNEIFKEEKYKDVADTLYKLGQINISVINDAAKLKAAKTENGGNDSLFGQYHQVLRTTSLDQFSLTDQGELRSYGVMRGELEQPIRNVKRQLEKELSTRVNNANLGLDISEKSSLLKSMTPM